MMKNIEHAIGLRDEIREALKTICDHGTGIDTGGGMEGADLWVHVQGIEYYIQIRKSTAQILKDRAE